MNYHPALGNPGDFFFHYTTREAAFGHILPERKLRLSPALRMRDPIESNPALLSAAWGVEGADPEVEDASRVAAFEAMMRMQQLRQCSKVLSLTIDATDYTGDAEIFGRGYARARMWEQYAENYQGVCLMLHRNTFTDLALAEMRLRSPDSWAEPINYTHRGILDNPAATLMPSPGAVGADVIRQHITEHLPWLFFTKLLDWQSEHEFRFVESSTDDQFSYVEIGDTLAGVILGHKFPDWQMPSAFAWCERLGAQPWQMSWELGRPVPHQISPVPTS